MSQVAPVNASSGGAGSVAEGQPPETLDQITTSIAQRDQELKQLQQVLADLNARKAAKTAFEQEQTTSGKAIETALGKVEAAMQQAAEMTAQAAKVAANLSDEHVQGIKDAVERVDEQMATLRDDLAASIADVVETTAQDITARAESANAKAGSADAKRKLAERTRSIDLEVARIGGLVTEARAANTQGQSTTAYLLITDLQGAVDHLDELADPEEIAELQQAVTGAWERERDAGVQERAITWEMNKAKEAQQTAQTELTKYETGRRTELNKAVEAFRSDGGVSDRGPAQQPAQQSGQLTVARNEIVASPDDGQEAKSQDDGA